MKKIFVFLFNGFSDWEISYFTPEINKSSKVELVYFSIDGNPVTSMGGLQVMPSLSLEDLKPDEVSMLILPGGTAWEKGGNKGIVHLTQELFRTEKTIASICAATSFLAQLGMLNNLKHTTNDLYYLKAVAPEYKGEINYQNTLAVRDKNIITANGIAPIEFAKEIFKNIELKTDEELEKWFQLFKNGIWTE